MTPEILTILPKKLIGLHTSLSLSINQTKTIQLFQQFMPRRKEIPNKKNTNVFDIRLYDDHLEMKDFTRETIFEKWAAVEVSDLDHIPSGMESLLLKGGKYAVFLHKGEAATYHKTAQYIFETWLPNSEYELDNRAHFEILKEGYKPNDPDAEEEVWIPIK